MQRFRGGLVFQAHKLLNYSTLGLRVIKKKKDGAFQTPIPYLRRERGRGEREPTG